MMAGGRRVAGRLQVTGNNKGRCIRGSGSSGSGMGSGDGGVGWCVCVQQSGCVWVWVWFIGKGEDVCFVLFPWCLRIRATSFGCVLTLSSIGVSVRVSAYSPHFPWVVVS